MMLDKNVRYKHTAVKQVEATDWQTGMEEQQAGKQCMINDLSGIDAWRSSSQYPSRVASWLSLVWNVNVFGFCIISSFCHLAG